MLTNEQRAHDLAIAILKTQADLTIVSKVLETTTDKNANPNIELNFDFAKMYFEAYESALISFRDRS